MKLEITDAMVTRAQEAYRLVYGLRPHRGAMRAALEAAILAETEQTV